MRSHVCLPGSESLSRSQWQYCMRVFFCILGFFCFVLCFLLSSLERRRRSLPTPTPLITLASCTPRIRPALIPVPKGGGCKVYRSARDGSSASQNQDALGSPDTSFLTITRPHSSTTPVAVNQGQISKGAALFLPRIPFYGFL